MRFPVLVWVCIALATGNAQRTHATGLFDGKWTGTIDRGLLGSIDLIFIVSGDGATVTGGKLGLVPVVVWEATCDGKTVSWHGCATALGCEWTLTPNYDGKTALVTNNLPVGTTSAIFHKESPAPR